MKRSFWVSLLWVTAAAVIATPLGFMLRDGNAFAQCAPPKGLPACPASVCPLPPCAPPLPPPEACPISDLVFLADKMTMTWSFPADCPLPAAFDFARGDLDCLTSSCNPIVATCPTCNENNDVDFTIFQGPFPVPGNANWYLVRVDGGTWNSSGTNQCTDYDATLPMACP